MRFCRHLLWPAAILYGLAVWIRNRLFDACLLRSQQFDVPIICVGNLETGGTGKSPLAIHLVELLRANGMRVATLSRGYGRSTEGFLLADVNSSAADIGDEPKQLKMRLPDVTVAVCENRVAGVRKLLDSKASPDVIIMDDGFQHRWLKSGLSVLVTSASFPFWKNRLLPVGTLREAKYEARRTDVLVVSGGVATVPREYFDGAVFMSETIAGRPIQMHGEQMEADTIEKVVLLSGIGNPTRFGNTAKQLFTVSEHIVHPDHHRFTAADLLSLRKKMDSFEADAVLTTEKDAMRLKDSPLSDELGQMAVFYLPIDISIGGDGPTAFDKLILNYVGKDK